jgi:acyl carrier protein
MIRRDIDKAMGTLIGRELGVSLSRVKDAADLRGDLGANGAGLVRLQQALLPAFGILLTADEMAFATTVGTLCDLIETKLENRRVP